MNRIFIADLKVETRIGVYEWEQQLTQPLLLNLDIEPGSAAALASDSFADALDYAAVVARVKVFAAEHPHKLLERFAAALADLVCEEFGARWVSVSVAKPAPIAGVRQIGVVVERGKQSA
ncbi:MAG TPA: dihydroneopterin aldolase [Gemmatimonadaceae bacterium]